MYWYQSTYTEQHTAMSCHAVWQGRDMSDYSLCDHLFLVGGGHVCRKEGGKGTACFIRLAVYVGLSTLYTVCVRQTVPCTLTQIVLYTVLISTTLTLRLAVLLSPICWTPGAVDAGGHHHHQERHGHSHQYANQHGEPIKLK